MLRAFERVGEHLVMPMGDWLLVRIEAPTNMARYGLVLAEREFNWTERAKVLAVGNGRRIGDGSRFAIDDPKVGDIVVFSHRPSHDKGQLEASFGKGAFVIVLDQIDGVVVEYVCKTCEEIAENFSPHPRIEIDGHVSDCPHHHIAVHELESNLRCRNADCPCQLGLDCLSSDIVTKPFERAP